MSVKPKRKGTEGIGRLEYAVSARDLLAVGGTCNHPLHKPFMQWCADKGTEPTKRQAAKFLQAHPQYREVKHAE